ncbi:MAG TPA: UDP-glucose/GDP-mannose dehydrogenase family protein, partial [Tepidisphaeraceae bacterium]|nr:UDP-glucose/GDP-mannose dehydrogenase family protein [Tepidisphaeraceae bacterium]
TLRRSASVELCRWMHGQGYGIHAYDPAVRELPDDLRPVMELRPSAAEALSETDLAVVATEWPEIRQLNGQSFVGAMRRPAVIDPNWFLADALADDHRVRYVTTGRDRKE